MSPFVLLCRLSEIAVAVLLVRSFLSVPSKKDWDFNPVRHFVYFYLEHDQSGAVSAKDVELAVVTLVEEAVASLVDSQ